MKQSSKKIPVLFLALFAVTMVSAQKKKKVVTAKPAPSVSKAPGKVEAVDTSSPKMVTITSAFKPSLRSAAKVNFIAATPVIDSSKIPVTYVIPSQNLFFSYKAVSIKPLALNVDSSVAWENDHYIKLGAGNFSSYLGEAGFSFGDGKSSITNLRGSFVTSTGHLFAQQANKLGIDALSIIKGEAHEWNAHAFYKSSTQYFYGYQPATLNFLKDDLLQRFNTVGIQLGVQNNLENPYGILYHPQVSYTRFADNREASQHDIVVSLPVSKVFNKFYAFTVGVTADMTTTNFGTGAGSQTNGIYYVQPAFLLTTPNLKLHLGVQPSWDNKVFSALPDLTAEAKLTDAPFLLEAGWKGYYQKNTYRSLSDINPWIDIDSAARFNNRINEQYAGVKGTAGEHFTYGARISLLHLHGQALFINRLPDGRKFDVTNDEFKAIRLHAEIAYTVGEKISLLASTNFTQYGEGLQSPLANPKPWGLLPFDMTGTLKWKVLKDLLLKADAFMWDGAYYRETGTGKAIKADPAADISLGAEFTVLPRLNLWVQANNILNSAYQRWNQYPVLGFTVLGGVVYSFR